MFELELSMSQKAIYRALSQNVKTKAGSSADFIRNLVRYGYNINQQNKDEANKKIQHNNDTLAKHLADKENATILQNKKNFTSDLQTVLQKRTSELFEAKRNVVTQFIKQMPSDSLDRKIEYVQKYGHMFGKKEWEIFITDPEIASNYLASKIVQKKAEENGIDYVIGFNPERVLEKIDQFETMVNTSIDHLDDEHDLILRSLIADHPNNPVSNLINDLDSDISTIIPESKRTVLKRLQEAEKHAYDTDNVRLSVLIKSFTDRHKSELATPEEIKDELFQQAENFISQGMSAKKGDE